MRKNKDIAYIIGVAIGDGNISNPNGRAYRLRISCDVKYPYIINRIKNSLSKVFLNNKISEIRRKDNCVDISCYSNSIPEILGWYPEHGTKLQQAVTIPMWIKKNEAYVRACLRGLFETDGSIYKDRKYVYVNFVSHIKSLAYDVQAMIHSIGFNGRLYTHKDVKTIKYTIRISKNVAAFQKCIGLYKN